MANDPFWHKDKELREVLELARDYGWPEPIQTTNHPYKIVKCPGDVPSCGFPVMSSGKGASSAARTFKRKVRSCPHGTEQAFAEIARRLDGLQRLIEGTEKVLSGDLALARVEVALEELGAAELEAEELEARLQEAVESEGAANRLRSEGEASLSEAQQGSSVEDNVGAAHKEAGAIQKALRTTPDLTEQHLRAKERLKSCRTRIARARRLLRELRSLSAPSEAEA